MWIGYKSTACCGAWVTIFLSCCQFSVVLCVCFFVMSAWLLWLIWLWLHWSEKCSLSDFAVVILSFSRRELYWEGLSRPGVGGRGGGTQLRKITLTHTCTCSQTCEEKNTFILTNRKWIFLNARAYRSKSDEADKFVILQASLCLQAYFYCLSYD